MLHKDELKIKEKDQTEPLKSISCNLKLVLGGFMWTKMVYKQTCRQDTKSLKPVYLTQLEQGDLVHNHGFKSLDGT